MIDERTSILARIRETRRASTVGMPRRQPPLPVVGEDLVAAFSERARKLVSDVIGPVTRTAVPGVVASYLRERRLPLLAVAWPETSKLDWETAGLTIDVRAAHGADLVGINEAFCALAETGTLMLLSGPGTPAAVSLLPETHVALLPVSRIVARMEDAWALLRKERGSLPRAVNFISGPSRTADIEQTVTLGAHGPYRVLAVLVEG
ncbi:MAG: lactate utilization protein C [Gammaproteobacteria bacterium]|nr:lactate utilization protein C [Gammaproteobacteria bacterium]